MTKYIGNARDVAELLPGFTVSSGYSSPEALARFVEQGVKTGTPWQNSFQAKSESQFYGTSSIEECLKLAKDGWKEGAQKADKLRGLIAAKIPRSPRLVKYDVAGAVPNIPRAVSGNPLNMRALDLAKSRRRPVLTLVSNMAVNCGVDANAISNHASVVAALIDQIEDAGFACEVLSCATTRAGYGKGSKSVATTCRVKQSNQPVDLPRLAFALGHASFYRRLIFGDWGLEKESSFLGQSLGCACPLEPEALNKQGVYVIPESSNKLFGTEEKAMNEGLQYLLLSLKRQECPALPKLTAVEREAAKAIRSDSLSYGEDI